MTLAHAQHLKTSQQSAVSLNRSHAARPQPLSRTLAVCNPSHSPHKTRPAHAAVAAAAAPSHSSLIVARRGGGRPAACRCSLGLAVAAPVVLVVVWSDGGRARARAATARPAFVSHKRASGGWQLSGAEGLQEAANKVKRWRCAPCLWPPPARRTCRGTVSGRPQTTSSQTCSRGSVLCCVCTHGSSSSQQCVQGGGKRWQTSSSVTPAANVHQRLLHTHSLKS
jgi:hypothetical protein